MGAKKPILASMMAVLLMITATSAPITVTGANEQAVVVSSDEVSVSGADSLSENDLLENVLSGNILSENILSGNDFAEDMELDIEEQEITQVLPEEKNSSEEIPLESNEEDFLDLMDQESLDRALAEGKVEFRPNEEENANDEYPRAAASGSGIVEIAAREVGVSGCPNKYTYWLGTISGSYTYAWCHAFVSWCASQAGMDSQIPRTASCFYGVQGFKAQGRWKSRISGYVPKAGDIIYFDWNANGGYDHVGIVNYVSAGRVHTIEGNAGNAVRYDGGRTGGYALTDSQIIGYGTPDYGSGPQAQVRGCLDSAVGGASSVKVRGWAFDNSAASQALDVHVYVGGVAGSGAPGYAIKANKSRPDVGAVYPGVGDSHGFDATITVNRTGSQPVFVYALCADGKGDNPLIGSSVVNIQPDTQKPVISDVKVSDISVEGYTVTCKVSDNVGIKKVSFPSWHESKTGNEAVWLEGTVKNGQAKCYVPIERLGNQSGKYTTHIYAYDMAGNYTAAAAKTVAIDLMDLGQYKLQNISSDFIASIESEHTKTVLTGQEDERSAVGQANHGTDNQIWEFHRMDDGSYSIRLKSNGKYLGVSEQSYEAILLEEMQEQFWRIYQAGDDRYYLNPQSSESRVLEAIQKETDVDVVLDTFYRAPGQRFRIRKLSTNVKSLSLNQTEVTLTAVGQTASLQASVKPQEAADEKICWNSDNEKVVSVDKNGLVTAVDDGTAVITASTEDGSISVACKVSVEIQVTGVALSKQQIKLTSKGAQRKLTAKVTPQNAHNPSVTWKSDNKKVAKVDSSGHVTAVASGSATVTAQTVDGKKTAVCQVTVQIPKVGAGGTVKKSSYTYSADFIPNGSNYKTVIYRQKKKGGKEKIAQIGAKAYLKFIYGKNLYYEKAASSGKRNLWAMDTKTFKKKSIRSNSTVADHSGRYILVKPYSSKIKPQSYSIWNAVTGKGKKISSKCLAAVIIKSKVYYVETISGSAAKGWKVRVRSCSLSANKNKYLTGKITVNACKNLTDKSITYQSGKNWYRYSFATKKRKKINS